MVATHQNEKLRFVQDCNLGLSPLCLLFGSENHLQTHKKSDHTGSQTMIFKKQSTPETVKSVHACSR